MSQFFELIFKAIEDPKPAVREAAVEALRAALVVTSHREQKDKPQWYEHCYEETINMLNERTDKVRDDKIHGALLVLNELMRCSNIKWEKQYLQLMEKMEGEL